MGFLSEDEHRDSATLHDIAYSAAVRRSHHNHRLTVVGRSKLELADNLRAFLAQENALTTSVSARGLTVAPTLTFVCSGMGQQWWAMGRESLAEEGIFRQAIAEIDAWFTPLSGWSLLAELEAPEELSRIQETAIAQPAIFALQVALAARWRAWGIQPAAIVGHSVGEVAAAHLAGACHSRMPSGE